MRKSCVFICYLIGSVVKLYDIYIFFTQRATDLDRLRTTMDDGTIIFLTSLLIALTKQFVSLLFMTKDNFMFFIISIYSFLST